MRYFVAVMSTKIGRPRIKHTRKRLLHLCNDADAALVAMAKRMGQSMTRIAERALMFAAQHRDFVNFGHSHNR